MKSHGARLRLGAHRCGGVRPDRRRRAAARRRRGSGRGRPRRARGLVREQEVEEVVVGHPLTLRGERGEQARATERFVKALRAAVDVPVVLFDERFTTDLAQQTASATSEDARAAAHLLSSYLEWAGSSRR